MAKPTLAEELNRVKFIPEMKVEVADGVAEVLVMDTLNLSYIRLGMEFKVERLAAMVRPTAVNRQTGEKAYWTATHHWVSYQD